jgi:hypothetical protein
VPDIDAWAGNTFPLSSWLADVSEAVDAARIVGDKITSITIIRTGVALDAQNVRIEDLSNRPRSYQTEAGETALAEVLIVGYKNHATITDTDIQRGDRFALDGISYRVVAVVPGLVDCLQAFATTRS